VESFKTVAGTGISSFSGDGGGPHRAALFPCPRTSYRSGGDLYCRYATAHSPGYARQYPDRGGQVRPRRHFKPSPAPPSPERPTGLGSIVPAIYSSPRGESAPAAASPWRLQNLKINGVGIVSTAAERHRELLGRWRAATAAQMNTPSNMVWISVGNLYVADSAQQPRAQNLRPAARIVTVAA